MKRLSPFALVLCLAACAQPGAAPVEQPIDQTTTEAPKAEPDTAWVREHFGPNRFHVPYLDTDLQRGANEPLVTIVVFFDYSDGGNESVGGYLEELLAAHGDEVLVVVKPFVWKPIETARTHRVLESTLMARAVLAAASQDRGWAMHEALLDFEGPVTNDALVDLAEHVGVPDLSPLRAALQTEKDPALPTNSELAEKLGVSTSPFLFVNGAPYADIVSFADLQEIHAVERELATGLVKAGAPPEKIYSTIMSAATSERELTIPYRPPFDGAPLSSATLPGGILIEEFVLGEGERVAQGHWITYEYRKYNAKSGALMMSSREQPSDMILNEATRKKNLLTNALVDVFLGMKPGGKRRATIPVELLDGGGPGPGGQRAADLIFTVELISVARAP